MSFKHIHFILNPAAGSDEPILSHINQVFCESDIKWDISVTQKAGDGCRIAESLIGKTDLVAVYGGDGSLTEVASALQGSATPMGIIPGGTANVTAKELGIPQDAVAAMELFKNGEYQIAGIDVGMANTTPFIIRVNFGIMADMIFEASRELKNKIGQLAYGVTAMKSLFTSDPLNFKMVIDGKQVNDSGVALTVTNAGSLGIGSFGLLPGINISDGLLDVVLMNTSDMISVLRIAGSTLFQRDSEVLKHWQCREVTISSDKPLKYLCDDIEKQAKELHIKILPKALNVVVPAGFRD